MLIVGALIWSGGTGLGAIAGESLSQSNEPEESLQHHENAKQR
jgi:hypothetical protein